MKIKSYTKRIEPLQLSAMVIASVLLVGLGFLTLPSPGAQGVAPDEVAWATDVTAGGSHTCAIYNLGTPYCWGENGDGQLGMGDLVNRARPYPVDISGLTPGLVFKQISAGFFHTCAVVGISSNDSQNTVYCWGKNDRGQLGLGVANSTLVTVPTTVGSPGGLVAKKVSAGFAHTCATYGAAGSNTSNVAYCWGNNDEGQLGDGSGVFDTTSQTFTTLPTSYYSPHAVVTTLMSSYIIDISAGSMSSCAVAATGMAYCWGAGGSGQLGNNSTDSSSSPVENPTPYDYNQVSAVGVGWFYGCVIESGQVQCWGDNTSGQLGIGNNSSTVSRIAVGGLLSGRTMLQVATGYAHTCTIAGPSATAVLYCWGDNSDGQVLNGNTGTNTNTPVAANLTNVPSGYVPKKVATGWGHTCAIYGTPDSEFTNFITCGGDNSDGQVGDNTLNSSNVLVPLDTTHVEGIGISLDLEVSSVDIYVTPSSTGESGRNIATVTTEFPAGYTLTMQADDANLVCNSGPAMGQTIPSLALAGTFPAGQSSWGWNLGTFAAGAWQEPTTWQVVPVVTPVLIAQTGNASATAGDDHGVFFGVRVDATTQPCNSYDQTLTLTATMNI